MINDLCKLAHDAAVSKGFYERQRNLPELLMLVVSELAEAMEADRHGKTLIAFNSPIPPRHRTWDQWLRSAAEKMNISEMRSTFETYVKDTVEDEIADAFIRLFDLCGFYGIDIEAHIKAKMAYNATRPAKHGKKY